MHDKLPLPETAYQPPDYEIQCTSKASFLQQTPYDPTSPVTYLGEGDEYSGVTSPYAYGDNVLACDPGTRPTPVRSRSATA